MIKAHVRRSVRRSIFWTIPALLLPLLFAGCSSTSYTGTKTPPTVAISANPTSIAAGASSTLTVTAANATSVTVAGSDGSSYTLAAAGGTQAVKPTATTTYTATATGAGGSVTAAATVKVSTSTGPAPTVTIAANPTSIAAGSSSTLTVTATNATTVTIAGSDGSSYTLAATGGTQAVKPAATTIYTATATGAGGTITATATVTVSANPAPTVTITASPASVPTGSSSTLTVTAAYATSVVVTAPGGVSYTLAATGGTQAVSPTVTTTYTATATGAGGTSTATATVTVTAAATVQSVDHVIFMLQENHTFDNYFGMLNLYREANGFDVGDDGVTYAVDGIEDKLTKFSSPDDAGTEFPLFPLTSTCVDDETSAWLASYGDVSRYDFDTNRKIEQNGFAHTAEGYYESCTAPGASCSGNFTDSTGQRSMGYYDEKTLNYYYYMASQFAVSDRWFSPVASKSIDNRIATFSGGTTQGLVQDPGGNDHLPQLALPTIFRSLDAANVSWKIYYTVTTGFCTDEDDCPTGLSAQYPATDFENFTYSFNYLRANPKPGSTTDCPAPMQPSNVVGDKGNTFCIDTAHIAPIAQYYSDLTAGTLPSFAFIEAGYARNDEHPGSGQSILEGQAEVAKVVGALMATSTSDTNNYWADSVFFFSYDEGGGPFDHVPPVPGYSNKFTDAMVGDAPVADIPDIGGDGAKDGVPGTGGIAVNPDSYFPCLPPELPGPPPSPGPATTHCDLNSDYPGAEGPLNAPTQYGFAAQLGFRLPNIVISPFTRKHYVSHIPMDHTAVIRFVEDRFIGNHKYLTNRDAAQPDLLDFFDFNGIPWATPPTPPTPNPVGGTCHAASFAP